MRSSTRRMPTYQAAHARCRSRISSCRSTAQGSIRSSSAFRSRLRLEGTVRGTGGLRIVDDSCATSVPGSMPPATRRRAN